MRCYFKKYQLHFKKPGGTSRGVLYDKDTYIIIIEDASGQRAFGECNLFKGLSADDREDYEDQLAHVCKNLLEQKENILPSLIEWPSIAFGVETVLKDWRNGSVKIIFSSAFTQHEIPISINGLVWMGSSEEMLQQIRQKLQDGFTCLKLKIGAINFESELEILKTIRNEFTENEIELRVDANGAFSPKEAPEKLKRLSDFNIHSIEQPIKAAQWDQMASIVKNSPIAIALDEEIIGVNKTEDKQRLIDTIKPEYIILKPTLVGGFASCDEWINIAEKASVKWWITSALESNIGLNAIAQYTYLKNNPMPQGLGTGKLYSNNFDSPLQIKNGNLFYDQSKTWNMNLLFK